MPSFDDNVRDAIEARLGESMEGGAFFRLAVPAPRFGPSAPPIVALWRVLSWVLDRQAVRGTGLPAEFFLAVTPAEVAVLTLRFGAGVRVRRVVRRWRRTDVSCAADLDHPAWVVVTRPDGPPVKLEPTRFDDAAAGVVALLSPR